MPMPANFRPTKRPRTRYKNRPNYSRHAGGFKPLRSTPFNQMSRYMSRNNPFPAVEYATLRYVQTVTITGLGGGTPGHHTFNGTSIYDPDFTGTVDGGQPYGHDAYAGIYHNYKVLSATCSVQGAPSTSSDFPGFGINVDDDTFFQNDRRWLMASKGSTYSLGGQNEAARVLSRTYNHNMMQDQSALCAEFGASPTQPFFFRIFSLTGQSNRDIECIVTINYRVQMWGLKGLTIT